MYCRTVTKREVALRANETTADNPWPLALLSKNVKTYVDKMSQLWVEAQVVEHRRRPGTSIGYFVVRDINDDISFNVKAFLNVIDAAGPAFVAGAHVILQVKPDFWEARGSLSLHCARIIVAGEGGLMAQLEELRKRLGAEGLFDNKKPLPFIPKLIGLISGRNAQAMHDVMVNAQKRWPGARFEVREVAVQGDRAAPEVGAALKELAANPQVDVIVITRGGGSVEDLLPFSDERLLRLAASVETPIVSAIGHEQDSPILDLVADYRASTPTAAAERIVPSWNELAADMQQTRGRLQQAILRRLQREQENLTLLVTRPVLATPAAAIEKQQKDLEATKTRLNAALLKLLHAEETALTGAAAALKAMSPEATMQRGYAILRTPDKKIVRDASALKKGELLEGFLAEGTIVAQVAVINPEGKL